MVDIKVEPFKTKLGYGFMLYLTWKEESYYRMYPEIIETESDLNSCMDKVKNMLIYYIDNDIFYPDTYDGWRKLT